MKFDYVSSKGFFPSTEKPLVEVESELKESWRDFLFEFGYSIGIIYLIERIKFLKLKHHYQIRLNDKKNIKGVK